MIPLYRRFRFAHYRVAWCLDAILVAGLVAWLAPGHRAWAPGIVLLGFLCMGFLLDPAVNSRSSRYGVVLWRLPTDKKLVSLTFDDGPSPLVTDRILDVLREGGAPATFFLIGRQVRAHPDLARRIRDEGHLVGNHTASHANLLWASPETARREIEEGAQAIQEVLGTSVKWFRPPFGLRAPWVVAQARAQGQATVLWTTCPCDWERPGSAEIVKRALEGIQPGTIILLHDGGGDREQTLGALPLLIQALRDQGFTLARVDEVASMS